MPESRTKVSYIFEKSKSPLPPGGDGGDNGRMEARIAKLEAATEHIVRELSDIKADVRQVRGDLRTQFYWMLSAFAALLVVMAKGFGWL